MLSAVSARPDEAEETFIESLARCSWFVSSCFTYRKLIFLNVKI